MRDFITQPLNMYLYQTLIHPLFTYYPALSLPRLDCKVGIVGPGVCVHLHIDGIASTIARISNLNDLGSVRKVLEKQVNCLPAFFYERHHR